VLLPLSDRHGDGHGGVKVQGRMEKRKLQRNQAIVILRGNDNRYPWDSLIVAKHGD